MVEFVGQGVFLVLLGLLWFLVKVAFERLVQGHFEF